ncbi:alpha/beta hydrolase [Streptomyces sp. NPDC008343]|uniref:alpha/beta hydrolase n=1 Tax=Streptomyces sp. NPDC008343 TaxID=3364828 RepID=UPI0036DFF7FC
MNQNLTDASPSTSRPRRARRRHTLGTLAAVGLVAAAVASACGPATDKADATTTVKAAKTPDYRGKLVSVTPLGKLNRGQISEAVSQWFQGAEASLRHGTAAYRLEYRTITPKGRPTTATGLLVIPEVRSRQLTTVLHSHGTLAYRNDAPSVDPKGLDRLVASLYASGGRAVVAPDYLGLGKGPGRHPYLHNASAVSASVDMLRAARKAAPKLGKSLNGDVYGTGFSQGGQVTMAVGRALGEGHERGWRLRALAPVSGPYAIEKDLRTLDEGPTDIAAVSYITYLLTAQNSVHRLYDSPSEVFRAPYDKYADELFDSDHTGEEIVKKLPATVPELLTDKWYRLLTNPAGNFQKVLQRIDTTCDWSPKVPVHLYAASGDKDIPIANTRNCASQLSTHGVTAKVIDQGAGAVDHFGSFQKSVPQIAQWIDQRER